MSTSSDLISGEPSRRMLIDVVLIGDHAALTFDTNSASAIAFRNRWFMDSATFLIGRRLNRPDVEVSIPGSNILYISLREYLDGG